VTGLRPALLPPGARRAAAALALLLAAAPAQAFKRSCDPSTGACFYWPSASVTWKINPSQPFSSASCSGSGPLVAAAQAAFAQWANATRAGDGAPCTALSLPYGGATSSTQTGAGTAGEHIVVLREGWCTAKVPASDPCHATNPPSCDNTHNCFEDEGGLTRSILAITTVYYTPSTGAISDADIELADWGGSAGALVSPPPDGWYFTCLPPGTTPICGAYGQASCAYIDLQNTLTHEAGHFIGLAHPCEIAQGNCTPAMKSVTMYPSAAPGETSKRVLSQDDVDGVCAIYPLSSSGPPGGGFGIPVAVTPSRSGGCGAGAPGPAGLLPLLATLLPRVRRRRARQRTITPA